MSSLRLGVACAVLDDEGRILLSKRGDFNIWNLPTGRLDSHETLEQAAVREVQEETGVDVEIVRAAGLYFSAGRDRMNVLYTARPTGGTLKQQTRESRANKYFSPDDLPDDLFGGFMVHDALDTGTQLHILETPESQLRQLRFKLAVRWVRNLLSGHPEAPYPHFNVHASLAVRNPAGHILSLPDKDRNRILPGLIVNGKTAPWMQVQDFVRSRYDLYELRQAVPIWRGLWQNPASNTLEFIFLTDIQPVSSLVEDELAWTHPEHPDWWQGYRPYMHHIHVTGVDSVLSRLEDGTDIQT